MLSADHQQVWVDVIGNVEHLFSWVAVGHHYLVPRLRAKLRIALRYAKLVSPPLRTLTSMSCT